MKKTKIPFEAKRIPLQPLAFGEVTGHEHRLIYNGSVTVEDACELYEFTDGKGLIRALRVTADGISLIHADQHSNETAEHHAYSVPPGEYVVTIQEEETDWGRQQVTD